MNSSAYAVSSRVNPNFLPRKAAWAIGITIVQVIASLVSLLSLISELDKHSSYYSGNGLLKAVIWSQVISMALFITGIVLVARKITPVMLKVLLGIGLFGMLILAAKGAFGPLALLIAFGLPIVSLVLLNSSEVREFFAVQRSMRRTGRFGHVEYTRTHSEDEDF